MRALIQSYPSGLTWRAVTAVAFVMVIIPVIYDLAVDYWWQGLSGQAPIVLGAAGFAIWNSRTARRIDEDLWDRRAANILLGFCLADFFICKSQQFLQGESLILLLAFPAICILVGGIKLYRKLLFFQFLLLLALPLPYTIADAYLVPLKVAISEAVVQVLAQFGYPVAVSGVVINIGFSELLMADACSGLWSLVSLITVGLLFLYFLPLRRPWQAALFLLLIVPIALATNFLRLLALVLIAFFFGVNAEAMAHDYAAFAELICSLGLFSLVHTVLDRSAGHQAERPA